MLAVLLALSLGACAQSETATEDPMSGRRDGCVETGGRWDATSETCIERPHWRMAQDTEAVSFAFDDSMDTACPSKAFWSATMTLSGADDEILWFTDHPSHHAFVQPTADFVANFGEAFAAESGGNPNAVLSWRDTDTGADLRARVELRYVDASSPSYDPGTSTLVYQVCGLRLGDPDALTPLPDAPRVRPPTSLRRASLRMDGGPNPPEQFAKFPQTPVGAYCLNSQYVHCGHRLAFRRSPKKSRKAQRTAASGAGIDNILNGAVRNHKSRPEERAPPP